ncbi:MAG: thioredoxin domain-containing protein [Burkholderiales bacterium]
MPNYLASETSPYLLQHADNPVEWYPWGKEALRRAREEDKPILLSVGYSACHWCHVMAHESFEDDETAKVMNRHFVNIKVDREERPDIDQIYQSAQYMLTGRTGGWPLTMFLTPSQQPFFGGTYFPNAPRFNLPGFKDLLSRVADYYKENRDDLTQNERLMQAFASTLPQAPGKDLALTARPVRLALEQLQNRFDPIEGGVSGAPKFPHPYELQFCLRRFAGTGSEEARNIAQLSFTKMAEGGIYDQLGGGFCRYSVDAHWTIPHFEKMLYDNGPLLTLAADLAIVTNESLFGWVANETADWVMREMQSPEGAYYSSLDADSEGHEGKYYVWETDDVRSVLSDREYAVVAQHLGLDSPPNFENRHWNLRVTAPLVEVAKNLAIELSEAERRLASAKAKLLAAREERIRPGRDEKILTSWNALMIKGMAHAGRLLQKPDWIASARRARDFIQERMWKNGRLCATYKDGRARLNAYLDDYAFLLDALIEFMQAEFSPRDLEFATALAEVLLEQFEDDEAGGFFFVSHDHEKLIHRAKSGFDNATPSGNGIAAFALQRLGHIVGEPRYLAAAERTLKLFQPSMQAQASAMVSLVSALEEHLEPPRIVILRGPGNEMVEWRRALEREYLPATLVLAIPNQIKDLPEALAKPESASVNAWVCQGVSCLPPIAKLSELMAICRAAS